MCWYILLACEIIYETLLFITFEGIYILNIIYIIMTLEIYKIWLNLTVINNSVIDDDKTYRSMIFIGWQDLYRSSSQQAKASSTKEKGRLFYGDCPNLEKKRTSSHQRLCCRAWGKDEASAPYSPRKKKAMDVAPLYLHVIRNVVEGVRASKAPLIPDDIFFWTGYVLGWF